MESYFVTIIDDVDVQHNIIYMKKRMKVMKERNSCM